MHKITYELLDNYIEIEYDTIFYCYSNYSGILPESILYKLLNSSL